MDCTMNINGVLIQYEKNVVVLIVGISLRPPLQTQVECLGILLVFPIIKI